MMLDVARTWVDAPHVKRYIDLLSYHNINKLHLHLSDDEGWRIEIRSHPELTEIGGFRGGDSPVRPIYGKWDEKYGGYYTQEQMRELIAYAAARNIEIIPEIDLPGHSRNIASVHPEIRCNYRPDTVSTCGYDYRSAWCVAREENYRLLEDILGELCALFPSPYIHIGGDEVDASQWERCPDCRALMERRGITDPHRLEDIFMQRMSDILAAHGKRPALWNEAVKRGGPARTSRVHGWESVRACLDAVDKGYPTVVMPATSFYFDMRQSPHEEGHSWAAVFDARTTYNFDFAREGFNAERMRHVEGLESAFWSEAYVSHEPEKPDYLDYMTFPRLCALSRLAWSGNEEGWESYYRELVGEHYDRMTAMGIRFRLFPPTVSCRNGELTASTDDGLLPRRLVARGAFLYRPHRHHAAVPLPLLHAPRHGPQPRGGRPLLLPHRYPLVEAHLVDAPERALPGLERRALPRHEPHEPHLAALHLRHAAALPRALPPDGIPAAAQRPHRHGLCRGLLRRRTLRAGRSARQGVHHAPSQPAGEGRAARGALPR